jgi:hypothetical protein
MAVQNAGFSFVVRERSQKRHSGWPLFIGLASNQYNGAGLELKKGNSGVYVFS